MATRAEAFRANEQKHGQDSTKKQKAGSKPGARASAKTRAKEHAAKKATYALEAPVAAGTRPSRKSTRKSANRAKPDADLTLREQLVKGTPENRFRKAHAKQSRVRGGTQHGPT